MYCNEICGANLNSPHSDYETGAQPTAPTKIKKWLFVFLLFVLFQNIFWHKSR